MEIENKLTQKQYKQVKELNKKAFELIQEFLNMASEMDCIDIKPIIERMHGLSKYTFKKIKIIVDWTKQELVEDKNNTNITRYYYDDVYSYIKNPVSEYKKVWKTYSRKMLKKLHYPAYRKEFLSIRSKIKKRLDELEKEVELE